MDVESTSESRGDSWEDNRRLGKVNLQKSDKDSSDKLRKKHTSIIIVQR